MCENFENTPTDAFCDDVLLFWNSYMMIIIIHLFAINKQTELNTE